MKSNFDFLNRYWPALAQIGATAETYVYSDPNACIYKLGMFAERLVQEILVFEHIAEPAVDITFNKNTPLSLHSSLNLFASLLLSSNTLCFTSIILYMIRNLLK